MTPERATLSNKCRRDAQRLALQCTSAMSTGDAMHSTGGELLRDDQLKLLSELILESVPDELR